MKKYIFALFAATLLTGCALPEQAYYTDREFGMASQDAFDQQVAYKDYRYAKEPVEGMAGLHSEPAMSSYHSTFNESFSSEDIDINQTGGE
ncbi:MAG: membrane lipoprotein lipid attachment site-containing protein [Desulfuromonadales bacterium]|nr:membrane lipoprotein lipid attachment site-containing protein [Desulfuromonadales bacterium]